LFIKLFSFVHSPDGPAQNSERFSETVSASEQFAKIDVCVIETFRTASWPDAKRDFLGPFIYTSIPSIAEGNQLTMATRV
jgi:hypothetical protein